MSSQIASAAIHRAYAKKARVVVPSLEDHERQQGKVVPMPCAIETAPLPAAGQD